MCGVIGLLAKTPEARERLGDGLAAMLEELAGRGPDSAGVAFYEDPGVDAPARVSLLDPLGPGRDWEALAAVISAADGEVVPSRAAGDQAVFVADGDPDELAARIAAGAPDLLVTAWGRSIGTTKTVGEPARLIDAARLRGRAGSHAVAHTRMATESRVSVGHCHPFAVAADTCLVHNGSLSNHHLLGRRLRAAGHAAVTDNDSEIAARLLGAELTTGIGIEAAVAATVEQLDGFFTFAIGDADGILVLRDEFGCKPAVLAETDDWFAVASELGAILTLPGAAEAAVWEAPPGRLESRRTTVAA